MLAFKRTFQPAVVMNLIARQCFTARGVCQKVPPRISACKVDNRWLNADEVRKEADDWDFSEEGRLRQAKRMADFAQAQVDQGKIALCDFVAPTTITRDTFHADFTIWLDTIDESRFEDTNALFEWPTQFNLRLADWNYDIGAIVAAIEEKRNA